MSHKALITFPDEQYKRLRTLSDETGAPVTELVRRAVSETYSEESSRDREKEELLAALKQGAGIWADRDEDLFEQIRSQWPVPKEW